MLPVKVTPPISTVKNIAPKKAGLSNVPDTY